MKCSMRAKALYTQTQVIANAWLILVVYSAGSLKMVETKYFSWSSDTFLNMFLGYFLGMLI